MNKSRKTSRTTEATAHQAKKSKIQLFQDENDENKENDLPEDVVEQAMKRITKSQQNTDLLLETYEKTLGELIKDDEKRGIIELHVVGSRVKDPNDKENSVILLALQGLFAYHLPNIPREYITRMVFDPDHKTVALLKTKQTIGGICFRSFPTQNFTEIAFCAITISEQMRGYGSYLMNHLKDYIVPKGIRHLLTFADLNAVGYFKKQDFTKKIPLHRSVYTSYIKTYSNATLMHCELQPNVVYTQVTQVVKQQRLLLTEITKNSTMFASKIYPGLSCFKDPRASIPIGEIPGLREFGWRPPVKRKTNRKSTVKVDIDELIEPSKLLLVFTCVLQAVRRHELSSQFLHPIDAKELPDYYDVIKYPMDLTQVGQRLNRGYYKTIRLFMADMARIFNNCRMYHSADTEAYDNANILEHFYQIQMRQLNLWNKPIMD